jgi:glycosyltransferase involved in cell wall biosynthesis
MIKRKILVVGERSVSPDGYAYADSFVEILQAQGHEVQGFDCTKAQTFFGELSRFRLNRFSRIVFERSVNRQFVQKCLQFKPDVCLVLKGDTLNYSAIARVKSLLKTRFILFYPDNPFLFGNGNSNAQVVASLPLYDVVLSWSKALMPIFTSLGVAHVCYFPFGYDARFFKTMPEQKQQYDLGFIGTADDERFELLRELIRRLPSLSIGIWGNRWAEYKDRDEAVFARYCGPAEYKEKMVELLRSCKIVLNPLRLQNFTSHNMRSLEAAAAGAFQLASYSNEHAKVLFAADESIALYKNTEELVQKINWYLAQPQQREEFVQLAKSQVEPYSLQRMLQRFFASGGCFCSTL